MDFEIIEWKDNTVIMLDQRLLPTEEKYLTLNTYQEVAEAIKNLTIRGAPAIGVAAAMGMALGALHSTAVDYNTFKTEMRSVSSYLYKQRPTAVNLRWGLERMERLIDAGKGLSVPQLKTELINEAKKIREEDIQTNRLIGLYGHAVLDDGDTVLTHCNAGALATAGFGTAIGVVYAAIEAHKKIEVFADETRPILQGARLSAWELKKNNVPVTLITDNMAATIMRQGFINKVIVGADRIAANGDTANKIGTYSVAINARYHNIPFYVAAPFSTIDLRIKHGDQIPIEERDHSEVAVINGKRLCPEGINIRNPAFDVTPAALISGILTEKGILKPPFETAISAHHAESALSS
ncbi:MAG: S-methyl-5-thioribose-1-phosphate isomerase [Deltaproteobacteria bacterium]|nr:S-methyl-5-thioribose-1-phosphate isomerase [Deltaproteobacteria bacterium]